MRIFKYVFGGLLVAMLLGLVGYLAREKIVLTVASYQLRNDITGLKQLAFKGMVMNRCNNTIEGYQLRFTSETTYVVEPVCDQEIEEEETEKSLWGGVRRLYGSGVMVRVADGIPTIDNGWVHLVYGESQTVVGFFDGIAKVKWNAADYEAGGDSPARASCSEWGFACCVGGEEVGELAQVRTYDCANNCYQQCNRRPLVLLFNTDPVINPRTREAVVPKSNPVVKFGYNVSDDQEGLVVEIDYGDGKKSGPLPAQQADLEHEYQCRTGSCVYTVTLTARDVSGNGLVTSELNQLSIIVR